MQAPFESTDGLARLKGIIEQFPPQSEHWNEAQNRFQFVDRLLTECLGWEKPLISVENTMENGGRTDYLLGQPAKAVLEAKKEALSFGAFPTGKFKIVRKIAPLVRSSKNLSDAVNQVLQYCVLNGAPLAIICNGPQLIVFQALTPGQSPLDGDCYYFNRFPLYLEQFDLLWSILSPDGISENRASRELAHLRNPRIPPKVSEFISEPYKYRFRNEFQENLRELSSLLLEEIEDNPIIKSSFYKECYVPLEANNRHLLLSKKIISNRYKRVGDDGVIPSALGTVSPEKSDDNFDKTGLMLQDAAGSRPVIVIGDVGVGKTSFFENLYENIENSIKSDVCFIHINLGIGANLNDGIRTYVLTEIPRVLNERYETDIFDSDFVNSAYHEEIIRFDKSVKGSLKTIDPVAYKKERIDFLGQLVERTADHLKAALGHLSRGRKKQIVLIVDNADQRNHDVQQEAFLIAQELAATRNMLVFIALRPSTYFVSKMTGALSGYRNKVLTVSPPPADQVVLQRLAFAIRVAEGKVAPGTLTNIRFQLGSVTAFLNATLRSIRNSGDIQMFLNNITGGNTRSVIELIIGFVGSPNVDSRKIVEIENETGNYLVPFHEFTKHALLGDYAYFNAQSSLVACNLFDLSMADPREHFLCSLLISYLSSNIGVRDSDGYIDGSTILKELLKHGFLEDQVFQALRRAASKRLIETPHAHYREVPVSDPEQPIDFSYRATSIGIYHVKFWTGEFSYLDAISIDTPIFDENARDLISKVADTFSIRDRLQRTTIFKEYLLEQWHLANIGASYYDFSRLLENRRESFEGVEKFVEKRIDTNRNRRKNDRRTLK